MNRNKKISSLSEATFVILCLLSSCIPGFDTMIVATFKNCTNDTLFIGASYYNNIDSVKLLVQPAYVLSVNDIDTANVSLWKGGFANSDSFVYPDSTCAINAEYLFGKCDTCYFFLVRWKDAKRYSWDEIHKQEIFRKWIVVRNAEGKFDMNIK